MTAKKRRLVHLGRSMFVRVEMNRASCSMQIKRERNKERTAHLESVEKTKAKYKLSSEEKMFQSTQ
jgi:hypothetical protein